MLSFFSTFEVDQRSVASIKDQMHCNNPQGRSWNFVQNVEEKLLRRRFWKIHQITSEASKAYIFSGKWQKVNLASFWETSLWSNSVTRQVNFKMNNSSKKIHKLTLTLPVWYHFLTKLIKFNVLSRNGRIFRLGRKTAFLLFLVLMSTIILTQKIEVDIVGLDVLLLWFSE